MNVAQASPAQLNPRELSRRVEKIVGGCSPMGDVGWPSKIFNFWSVIPGRGSHPPGPFHPGILINYMGSRQQF